MLDKNKTITILHGIFDESVFDLAASQNRGCIYVLEGRPTLKSSKKICAQLIKRGMTPTVMADNMAGFLFYRGWVKEIWLSYHKQDVNGAFCQVGSLTLAVLGYKHKVPVNIFPTTGNLQFLGQSKDLFYFNGVRVAPLNIKAYVPLMEWVSNKYITEVYPEIANTL